MDSSWLLAHSFIGPRALCRHEEAKRVRPADLEEAAVPVGNPACAGGTEDRCALFSSDEARRHDLLTLSNVDDVIVAGEADAE